MQDMQWELIEEDEFNKMGNTTWEIPDMSKLNDMEVDADNAKEDRHTRKWTESEKRMNAMYPIIGPIYDKTRQMNENRDMFTSQDYGIWANKPKDIKTRKEAISEQEEEKKFNKKQQFKLYQIEKKKEVETGSEGSDDGTGLLQRVYVKAAKAREHSKSTSSSSMTQTRTYIEPMGALDSHEMGNAETSIQKIIQEVAQSRKNTTVRICTSCGSQYSNSSTVANAAPNTEHICVNCGNRTMTKEEVDYYYRKPKQ